MQTVINDTYNECYIILNKTKTKDGMEYIDLSELRKALKALSVLGKEVYEIRLPYNVYFDIANVKTYKRYEKDFIERLYRTMNNCHTSCYQDLLFRNNRLYVLFEKKEIICPLDMYNRNSNNIELTLLVKYLK